MVQATDDSGRNQHLDQLDELVSKEMAFDALQEQTDSMAESARIMENHWRPKNRVLVAGLMAVSVFAGFLVADYGQIRLFSAVPEPTVDGEPLSERDETRVRAERRAIEQFNEELMKIRAKDDGSRLASLLLRAEMARKLAGGDPEKLKELNKFVIPKRLEGKDVPKTANLNNKPLKEGQKDEPGDPNSGVDLQRF